MKEDELLATIKDKIEMGALLDKSHLSYPSGLRSLDGELLAWFWGPEWQFELYSPVTSMGKLSKEWTENGATHYEFQMVKVPKFTLNVHSAMSLMRVKGYDLHIDKSERGKKDWEHWTRWQVRASLETPEEDPDETGPVALGCADTLAIACCICAIEHAIAIRDMEK